MTAPAPPEVRAVLDDVGRLGPFFVLGSAEPDEAPAWVPFARLHTDPAPFRERITQVRDMLGTDDRVAASIAFMSLAARLVAAPLAAVVLHGVLPSPSALARRPDGDDPWAPGLLALDAARTPDPSRDPDGAGAMLNRDLVETRVAPLVDAVRSLVPVSARVLWGNVASSLGGAGRVLEPARPAARPALVGVLAALLDRPPLRGTGHLLRLEEDRTDTEWSFRRNSCCLYYRIPGGGTCGDCVLTGTGRNH